MSVHINCQDVQHTISAFDKSQEDAQHKISACIKCEMLLLSGSVMRWGFVLLFILLFGVKPDLLGA